MRIREYLARLTKTEKGTETSETRDIELEIPRIEYHPKRRVLESIEEEQARRIRTNPHFYLPLGL